MSDEKHSKAGPGRPEVGGRVEVLLGHELKARVTDWAEQRDVRLKGGGVNRNEAVRRLTTLGLQQEETPVEHTAGFLDLAALEEHLTVIAEETDEDDDTVGVKVYSDGYRFWVTCIERGEVQAYTTSPATAAAAFAAALRAYEPLRDDESDEVLYPDLVAAAGRLHRDPDAATRQLIKSLHDNLVATPF